MYGIGMRALVEDRVVSIISTVRDPVEVRR
jgi:hypothetical protein